jgi:hypothetical protein
LLTLWGSFYPATTSQKKANTKSGTEMARDKEAVAAMMRQKQAAGTKRPLSLLFCAADLHDSRRKEGRRSREEIDTTDNWRCHERCPGARVTRLDGKPITPQQRIVEEGRE